MENMQVCPTCGTTNLTTNTCCVRSARFLFPPVPSGEQAGPEWQLSLSEQTRPTGSIVRSSSRRKFLATLVGSGVILGLGSASLRQLIQNVQVSFNTKNYPYDSFPNLVYNSFSPNFNLMALIKVGSGDDPDVGLYIWDYQLQRMTDLPAGPQACTSIWSPDGKYVLYQAQRPDGSAALDLWDVQARQKIRSYSGSDYMASEEISWSPEGSRIALLIQEQDKSNTFLLIAAASLTPLLTFKAPNGAETFTWAPDGRKIAVLVAADGSSSWSIQIWDLQTLKMDAEIPFQGQDNEFISHLAWSPDGTHIAALTHGQLHLLQVDDPMRSSILNEPNKYGKIAWSSDGKYLAVIVDADGDTVATSALGSRFDVWDVVERRIVRSFNRGSSDVPDGLGWSQDGKRIIVIGTLDLQENWDWS